MQIVRRVSASVCVMVIHIWSRAGYVVCIRGNSMQWASGAIPLLCLIAVLLKTTIPLNTVQHHSLHSIELNTTVPLPHNLETPDPDQHNDTEYCDTHTTKIRTLYIQNYVFSYFSHTRCWQVYKIEHTAMQSPETNIGSRMSLLKSSVTFNVAQS